MLGLGRGEIILCTIIVALIFGWAWIPRIGQRIGARFDRR
jgi:Sec-independent protein translocase protein TatA